MASTVSNLNIAGGDSFALQQSGWIDARLTVSQKASRQAFLATGRHTMTAPVPPPPDFGSMSTSDNKAPAICRGFCCMISLL
jgi:hypothetical protein